MKSSQNQSRRGSRSLCVALVFGALALNSADGANNLLINGDFSQGSSGWTRWTWGGGWANIEVPNKLNPASGEYNPALVGVYDGSMQLTCGGNNWQGGGGGMYQTVAASPGIEYTIVAQSGAQDWWLPEGEIRMIWLDAGNNEIGRDVVNTVCAIRAACSGGQDQYDIGVPYQNWTKTATAPQNTAFLKLELCNNYGTGSTFFDNAVLTSPLDPPVIANLYPNGTRLFQTTNKLAFSAQSSVPIHNSDIIVVIDGADVSGELTITGEPTNLSVTYNGLLPNRIYIATITVKDSSNLSTFKSFTFDTYAPVFTWEAEDYDHSSGQFVTTWTPGSYAGLSGVEGIDFHDRNGNGDHNYRASDTMAIGSAGDIPREVFVAAGASDYNVGWFDGAGFPSGDNVGISGYQLEEWVNFTRDFPPGTYNIYARLANGNGGTATMSLSRVTSGQGTYEQTASELGIFRFPANGWNTYAYVPLTDRFGNRIALSLSGTETLRLNAGSGGNVNFLMLMPVTTSLPKITDVYPDGTTLVQGTNKFVFTVASAGSSIPQSGVKLTLNGVDVSSTLTFSATASGWNVSAPLALNTTNYAAVISITDAAGNAHSTTIYFDTFDISSLIVEAEDFDFDGGQFIDNPAITSTPAQNSYFGKIGLDNTDSFVGDTAPPTTADFRYRELDSIATSTCTDTPTRKHLEARLTNPKAFNYNVSWWATNSWLNYTRTMPTGDYHVYARLAGDNNVTYSVALSRITGGTPDYLGTFTGTGRGYNAFDWVPLVNTNSGELVSLNLGGIQTLRTTTQGSVNPNNLLIVPAAIQPEDLQWSVQNGTISFNWSTPGFRLQVQTNAPGSGLSDTWHDYPGGASKPVNVPIDTTAGSLFFRLSN